ncbi:MAG TPA: hypothetical protein VG942_07425 [Hyphomonadaceae bacterium]|nr:hypothetical protein [Hyphomonadaceae bacterium]
MSRLLSAVLWVAVPCAAVACGSSTADTGTDRSSSTGDDDDDDSAGKADSGKKDAGKADAGKVDSGKADAGNAGASKADAGTGGDDGDDDDDDSSGGDDDDGGGGMASGDTYGAEPLCSGEPEDECQKCGCDECADEMAACNNIEGVAAEGPKAGTSKAELCRAVVDCGRKLGCRGQACITTPCAEQIFAAGELVNDIKASLPTLVDRSKDPTYAVTLASKVSDCTVMKCADSCK